MWFLLATSLLALSFQRLLALVLLLATCCLAFYDGVLAPPAVAALAALGVLALLRRRLAARRAWALGLSCCWSPARWACSCTCYPASPTPGS